MDDILLNKVSMIERCLKRINEDYTGHEDELESNFMRQDSIILNLQRACEASIDAAMHVVRVHKLGIPQQSRDAFGLMQEAKLLDAELADKMQRMVGFRNVAVHDYRSLNMTILRAILEKNLDDFRELNRCFITLANVENV
ncbi:MAG: DUF86 domain-containing protein [Mariprofundaceae bacterium]|nr:DUF86 domain-containing protein [Mariprofundaceae bacterium]